VKYFSLQYIDAVDLTTERTSDKLQRRASSSNN